MKQTKWLAVVLAALLVIGGIVYFWIHTNRSVPTNAIQNNDEQWVSYSNEKENFQIRYPGAVFQEKKFSCVIPVSEEKTVVDESGVAFEHSFPFEWQDAKGDTHQTMTDMSVQFCVVEGNYKNLAAYYYGEPTAVTIDDHQGLKIEMGAEGSGADVYYFQLTDNKTLVVGYYYFTPFFDQRLSEENQYLPIQKQHDLLKEILRSLHFN